MAHRTPQCPRGILIGRRGISLGHSAFLQVIEVCSRAGPEGPAPRPNSPHNRRGCDCGNSLCRHPHDTLFVGQNQVQPPTPHARRGNTVRGRGEGGHIPPQTPSDVCTNTPSDGLRLMEADDGTAIGIQGRVLAIPLCQRRGRVVNHEHLAISEGCTVVHRLSCGDRGRAGMRWPGGGGGAGTRPWWLALLACGGACWPLALEPSAMTSRHPHYCGCRGGGVHPPLQAERSVRPGPPFNCFVTARPCLPTALPTTINRFGKHV